MRGSPILPYTVVGIDNAHCHNGMCPLYFHCMDQLLHFIGEFSQWVKQLWNGWFQGEFLPEDPLHHLDRAPSNLQKKLFTVGNASWSHACQKPAHPTGLGFFELTKCLKTIIHDFRHKLKLTLCRFDVCDDWTTIQKKPTHSRANDAADYVNDHQCIAKHTTRMTHLIGCIHWCTFLNKCRAYSCLASICCQVKCERHETILRCAYHHQYRKSCHYLCSQPAVFSQLSLSILTRNLLLINCCCSMTTN